jgi:hypothetical protein
MVMTIEELMKTLGIRDYVEKTPPKEFAMHFQNEKDYLAQEKGRADKLTSLISQGALEEEIARKATMRMIEPITQQELGEQAIRDRYAARETMQANALAALVKTARVGTAVGVATGVANELADMLNRNDPMAMLQGKIPASQSAMEGYTPKPKPKPKSEPEPEKAVKYDWETSVNIQRSPYGYDTAQVEKMEENTSAMKAAAQANTEKSVEKQLVGADRRVNELNLASTNRGSTIRWKRDRDGTLQAYEGQTNKPLGTDGSTFLLEAMEKAYALQDTKGEEDARRKELELVSDVLRYGDRKKQALQDSLNQKYNLDQLQAAVSSAQTIKNYGDPEGAKKLADANKTLAEAQKLMSEEMVTTLEGDMEMKQVHTLLANTIKERQAAAAARAEEATRAKSFGENVEYVARIVSGGATPPADLMVKSASRFSEIGLAMQTPEAFETYALADPSLTTLVPHSYAQRVSKGRNMDSPEYRDALEQASGRLADRNELAASGTDSLLKALAPYPAVAEKLKTAQQQALAGGKEAQVGLMQAQLEAADTILANEIVKRFSSDVDSWNLYEGGQKINPFADPQSPLGSLYSEAKKTKGGAVVGVADLVAELRKKPSATERQGLELSLTQMMDRARMYEKGQVGGSKLAVTPASTFIKSEVSKSAWQRFWESSGTATSVTADALASLHGR